LSENSTDQRRLELLLFLVAATAAAAAADDGDELRGDKCHTKFRIQIVI
jgi:hypothetical protein